MSKVRMRTSTTNMKKSWEYWTVFLLGLFYIATKCDARAVNVSNSWTMPQEGLNVFYRFFRDRISWFEADAVCQFHHAYLVTVDNSFQFDATRDLLRELDVNDIVWIGLMRPQSSERFMWSNSKVLAANTGYWAESLPLMDSPLCAVIDPIRDYRWHALRCGGPETASFLCEMPVPAWAESCILKDLPSLTMQYMADTASIELIRNCGEEGLIRQLCRGKQDREKIMRELICPRERLESKKLTDITNSHFKSLQIIRGISTDNNEDNDIEMIPVKDPGVVDSTEQAQTEKNTVQKLIETFNVDELMQADEPARIPGEIPMPVKKSAKKIVVAMQQKKPTPAPKKPTIREHQKETDEEMMMGDQPIQDDASNEVLEPLPHIKKVLPQDLKKMPAVKSTTTIAPSTTTTAKLVTTVTALELDETSTAMPVHHFSTSEPTPLVDGTTSELVFTTGSGDHSTSPGPLMTTTVSGILPATQPGTIGHPMHPQQTPQQRPNTITEEANHPHVKETNDNHFIPPMLLVKSHYVPPSSQSAKDHPHQSDETTIENVQQKQHHDTTPDSLQVGDTIAPQTTAIDDEVVTKKVLPAANTSSEIQLQVTTTARAETTVTQSTQTQGTITPATRKPPTDESQSDTETESEAETVATTNFATEKINELIISTTTGLMASGASSPQTQTILPSSSSSTAADNVLHLSDVASSSSQTPHVHTIDPQTEAPAPLMVTEKTDQQPQQSTPFEASSTGTGSSVSSSSNTGDSLSPPQSADSAAGPSSSSSSSSTEGSGGIISLTTTATTTKAAPAVQQQQDEPHPTRNFLNEETYPPFKPNRRRSLTKPDTPSYFKKILG